MSLIKKIKLPNEDPRDIGALSSNITYDGDVGSTISLNLKLQEFMSIKDCGEIDGEDFDYEFSQAFDSMDYVQTGYYKFYEINDGFYVFLRVERHGDVVYQEWWSSEEGALRRYCRSGWVDEQNEEIDWSDDPDSIALAGEISNTYALKDHTHFIEVNLADNLDTYLNSFNRTTKTGDYIIYNNNQIYHLFYWTKQLGTQFRMYQCYSGTADDAIHFRTGFQGTSGVAAVTWGEWKIIAPNIIFTTWENLVDLRDEAKLVPGAFYRITDYDFVTSKINIQSGHHKFDIILLALTESMLSETAYAAKNANDDYFEREIVDGGVEWLYTVYTDDYGDEYGEDPIDHSDDIHSNDVFCDGDYMEHPVTGDTVPILYKTDASQFDIDDPDYEDIYFYEGTYDLDGDDYDMWSKYEQQNGDLVFAQQYALTRIAVENGEFIVNPTARNKTVSVNMNAWELKYCLDNDKALFEWADTNGKGVIYYMKDEFGNEAPYDFKNVKFERKYITATIDSVINTFVGKYYGLSSNYGITTNQNGKFYYTFSTLDGLSDSSLFGETTFNTIGSCIEEGVKILNDIICIGGSNNKFGNNCKNITLSNGGSSNIFDDYCQELLFWGGGNNKFSDNNRRFTLVTASGNTFGRGSHDVIGGACNSGLFGEGLSNSNLGSNAFNIKFGKNCSGITLTTWNYSIEIGDSVSSCYFANYCSYSRVESHCTNIRFNSSYIRYSIVEQRCSTVTITATGGGSNNYLQYIRV